MNAYVMPAPWATTSTASSRFFTAVPGERKDQKHSSIGRSLLTRAADCLRNFESFGEIQGVSSRPAVADNLLLNEKYVSTSVGLQHMGEILVESADNVEEVQTTFASSSIVADLALDFLCAAQLPAPHPMVSNDGIAGVFWRYGERYVSIDFEPDGEFIFGIARGLQVETGIWNVHSDARIPAALLNALPRG